MLLSDVLPYYPDPPKVDTLITQQPIQDTIIFAEETAPTSGGSTTLMWAIPALIAALAACLYILFMVRPRVKPNYRQQ